MSIALHHFFLLTDRPDQLTAEIKKLGLIEGSSNNHPGQGTANRRFFLPGTAFEILYVRDAVEAETGPAKNLRFSERINHASNCPFGLIVDSDSTAFPGWSYYPDYFQNEWFFHVGENSNQLDEPLCIVMPKLPGKPDIPNAQQNNNWMMTRLVISLPSTSPSAVLREVSRCQNLSFMHGEAFHMEIEFNNGNMNQTKSFKSDFPLTINW